jgi:hypothetical protein
MSGFAGDDPSELSKRAGLLNEKEPTKSTRLSSSPSQVASSKSDPVNLASSPVPLDELRQQQAATQAQSATPHDVSLNVDVVTVQSPQNETHRFLSEKKIDARFYGSTARQKVDGKEVLGNYGRAFQGRMQNAADVIAQGTLPDKALTALGGHMDQLRMGENVDLDALIVKVLDPNKFKMSESTRVLLTGSRESVRLSGGRVVQGGGGANALAAAIEGYRAQNGKNPTFSELVAALSSQVANQNLSSESRKASELALKSLLAATLIYRTVVANEVLVQDRHTIQKAIISQSAESGNTKSKPTKSDQGVREVGVTASSASSSKVVGVRGDGASPGGKGSYVVNLSPQTVKEKHKEGQGVSVTTLVANTELADARQAEVTRRKEELESTKNRLKRRDVTTASEVAAELLESGVQLSQTQMVELGLPSAPPAFASNYLAEEIPSRFGPFGANVAALVNELKEKEKSKETSAA